MMKRKITVVERLKAMEKNIQIALQLAKKECIENGQKMKKDTYLEIKNEKGAATNYLLYRSNEGDFFVTYKYRPFEDEGVPFKIFYQKKHYEIKDC